MHLAIYSSSRIYIQIKQAALINIKLALLS